MTMTNEEKLIEENKILKLALGRACLDLTRVVTKIKLIEKPEITVIKDSDEYALVNASYDSYIDCIRKECARNDSSRVD